MPQSYQAGRVEVIHIEMPTPLPVGPVNAFLLVKGDTKVLVDCGPKYQPAWDALSLGLARHGLSEDDITALVLTHGHVDHVGHTARFQRHGIPVLAHPETGAWLEPGGRGDTYRLRFFEVLYQAMGVPMDVIASAMREFSLFPQWNDRSVVDVPLHNHAALPGLPEFEVLYTPGHAQAALALWHQESGTLIAGDQVLPRISSNAFIEPASISSTLYPENRTKSLMDYRRSLSELSELPIQRVFPGHGDPFENPRPLLFERLEQQVERRGQLYDMLKEIEPLTAYELAVAYFPKHLDQTSLILSEVLGYLDWMQALGEAVSTSDETGKIHWSSL